MLCFHGTTKIEQNPDNYGAYNDRGKYRYEFDDKKGALKEINKALEINPHYSTAYLNRALIERDNKEYDKSKKDFDLAINYSPYDYEIYAKKGNMLYVLHSFNEAIEAYTKVIEIENIPYYLLCRCLAYYHAGDKENSIKDAKQAEKLFKKKDNERYKLAQKLQYIDFLQKEEIKELENEIFNFDENGKIPTFNSTTFLSVLTFMHKIIKSIKTISYLFYLYCFSINFLLIAYRS